MIPLTRFRSAVRDWQAEIEHYLEVDARKLRLADSQRLRLVWWMNPEVSPTWRARPADRHHRKLFTMLTVGCSAGRRSFMRLISLAGDLRA